MIGPVLGVIVIVVALEWALHLPLWAAWAVAAVVLVAYGVEVNRRKQRP